MKNACHLILGPLVFTIHLISGPTAVFFHLSLARLLGCGTAKISSTVTPLACGDLRRTKQVLFSSSRNFRPFAAIQVRPVLKDFTLDEENARHPSTQDGLLAPVTFLHGNPSAFPCCVL